MRWENYWIEFEKSQNCEINLAVLCTNGQPSRFSQLYFTPLWRHRNPIFLGNLRIFFQFFYILVGISCSWNKNLQIDPLLYEIWKISLKQKENWHFSSKSCAQFHWFECLFLWTISLDFVFICSSSWFLLIKLNLIPLQMERKRWLIQAMGMKSYFAHSK